MDTIIFNGNAVKSVGSIKTGDKVVITTTASGDKVACSLAPIKSGDDVTIVKLQNGDKLAVKVLKSSTCVQIATAIEGSTGDLPHTYDLSTVTFRWDGVSKVYALLSCQASPTDQEIYADDQLNISTSKGTVAHNYGGKWPGPPLEVSSILTPGNNEVHTSVTDLYVYKWGVPNLFLVAYPE